MGFKPDEHPQGITCFPTNNRPSGMKAGDYIYIAAINMDEKGNNTPVINRSYCACWYKYIPIYYW